MITLILRALAPAFVATLAVWAVAFYLVYLVFYTPGSVCASVLAGLGAAVCLLLAMIASSIFQKWALRVSLLAKYRRKYGKATLSEGRLGQYFTALNEIGISTWARAEFYINQKEQRRNFLEQS
jgi:hypothetical protein